MRLFNVLLPITALTSLAAVSHAQDFGPDDFGYIGNAIPSAFSDISGTGVDITAGFGANLDDAGQPVGIGFTFTFYGTDISTINVGTNGYLADDSDLTDFTNDCPIATTTTPNRGIYPFWDDLRLTEHGAVFVDSSSSALIVQFDDVGTFDDSSASLTFQVKLSESDDSIEFYYDSLIDGIIGGFDASGGGATIGIEGDGGSTGLEISCDMTGAVADGDGFRLELCEVLRGGSCENPLVYTSLKGCPLTGTTWTGSIDHTDFAPRAILDIASCSSQGPIDMPTGFGCLLINPSLNFQAVPAGSTIEFVIPDDLSLAGAQVSTQAVSLGFDFFGPTIAITNAIDTFILAGP